CGRSCRRRASGTRSSWRYSWAFWRSSRIWRGSAVCQGRVRSCPESWPSRTDCHIRPPSLVLVSMKRERIDRWLAVAVLGHLAVTFAHGAAHNGAHVPLGGIQTAFVLLVIEVAPVAGLWLSSSRPRTGAALVAAS